MKFTGECHKLSGRPGWSVEDLDTSVVRNTCDLKTDDWTLFSGHMADVHGIKSWEQNQPRDQYMHAGLQPSWVKNAGKPWKFRNSKTLFEPKPFDIGDVVTFVHKGSGNYGVPRVIRGQVWAHSPYAATRWVVADQVAYEVHEGQLLDSWLASQKAYHHTICRGGAWTRRGTNWRINARELRLAIREVERRRDELGDRIGSVGADPSPQKTLRVQV
jgi:hypothetical protein